MQSKDISVPVGAVLPYTGNLGNNQLNEMGWSIYGDSEFQISDYTTLFAAIGTCNGGNGNTRFNLPDYASEIVIVDTQELADQLHGDHGVVKLFYEQHYKYGCYSQNWGPVKGKITTRTSASSWAPRPGSSTKKGRCTSLWLRLGTSCM
ncbi:phage tail protein [Pseudomonas laurylsulfatiphila]|uniref:phage tail protein n=1 Tax=Pseudomonas laurylsulfatiphila TaxID=2011015 RepID=UPI003D1BE43A